MNMLFSPTTGTNSKDGADGQSSSPEPLTTSSEQTSTDWRLTPRIYKDLYEFAVKRIVIIEAQLENHEATIVLLQDCLREAYEGADDE